jgi:hypothetical protein
MARIRVGCLAVALLWVAAACSDNPIDIVEGDPLTEAEVDALAEVVAGTLFATWEQSSGPASGPARATGTFQMNDELPCEYGGSVAVSGSLAFDVDDETGDGTLNFNVTQEHADCVVESEEDIRFTLNGAPNITSSFTVVTEGSAISFAGAFDGAADWATGDKSGTCGLDVDFSLTGDLAAETGSASLTGRVCGVTFSHTLQLT